MSVVVLGWGSLIWRPTDHGFTLDLRTPGLWGCDGPRLPMEFARISRDGSLTLVIVPELNKTALSLWSVSALDEHAAVQNLAGREDIRKDLGSIHGVRLDGSRIGRADEGVATRVHGWLRERDGLTSAIWTGLGVSPSRWRKAGFRDGFSVDNAITYLGSLRGEMADRATEYVRRAPMQIDTEVRRRASALGLVELED